MLLFGGQSIDELEQRSPPLDFFDLCRTDLRRVDLFLVDNLSARSLPPVRNQVRRNPEQPCRKRDAAPLKSLQVRQRLMKHLSGHILRFSAIPHPPYRVGIHALEVDL